MSRKLFSMGISISITFSKTSQNIHQSQYIVPHKGNRPYLNTWTSLSIIPHPVMNWTLSVLPPQSWIKTNEGASHAAMHPPRNGGTCASSFPSVFLPTKTTLAQIQIRGLPYMTSAKFWDFLTKSPPCSHLGLIYSTKFMQPPLLHLLLG